MADLILLMPEWGNAVQVQYGTWYKCKVPLYFNWALIMVAVRYISINYLKCKLLTSVLISTVVRLSFDYRSTLCLFWTLFLRLNQTQVGKNFFSLFYIQHPPEPPLDRASNYITPLASALFCPEMQTFNFRSFKSRGMTWFWLSINHVLVLDVIFAPGKN